MSRRRRTRRYKDPFGVQSFGLATNRMNGRMAEETFELSQRLQGHDVRKIKKGGDYVVQKKDLFGRKRGKPKVIEVKNGDSQLSRAQKRMKKRLGRRYEVVRY